MPKVRPRMGSPGVSMDSLLEFYRGKPRQKAEQERLLFWNERDFEKALRLAGRALQREEPDVRFRHQNSLEKDALEEGYQQLLKHADWLSVKHSFDELHEFMKSVVGPIRGLGPLYAYDTALRIGFFHRVQPRFLYLHAGTREGAWALDSTLKDEFKHCDRIPLSRIEGKLRQLPAHEIENFLCIYKPL